MKKLLIMASLFWPQKNSGGPPISLLNLVNSIKDYFDIYVISKNHELNDDKPLEGIQPGWNQFGFGKAYYVQKGQHTYNNIVALINEVKPEVIYQNSFFSVDDLLPVLMYKKKHKEVKVIVAPRGELYPERIQVGKFKKYAYCKLFRCSGLLKDIYFQGTGDEECNQEHAILGIPENKLLNIQNLSIMQKNSLEPLEKKTGELKLVYIARIHPTKNTLKAIEFLKDIKGNIDYDIYGSIENEDYWNKCKIAINQLPMNIRVRYLGVIDHVRVADVISNYHAYYMPTSGENYGHSIVESMLLGKPVIISDQTPWTDVNGNGGYAIELNNKDGYMLAIEKMVNMTYEDYCEASHKIKDYLNSKLCVEETIQQYVDAFNG